MHNVQYNCTFKKSTAKKHPLAERGHNNKEEMKRREWWQPQFLFGFSSPSSSVFYLSLSLHSVFFVFITSIWMVLLLLVDCIVVACVCVCVCMLLVMMFGFRYSPSLYHLRIVTLQLCQIYLLRSFSTILNALYFRHIPHYLVKFDVNCRKRVTFQSQQTLQIKRRERASERKREMCVWQTTGHHNITLTIMNEWAFMLIFWKPISIWVPLFSVELQFNILSFLFIECEPKINWYRVTSNDSQ